MLFLSYNNTTRIRVLLFCFVLILAGCKEAPETKFEKDGISVTCPKGWEVTGEENLDGGYYVAIEKVGLNSSGLINLTWIYGEIGLEEWLEMYKEEFRNNIIYKNTNLAFGEPYPGTFNTFDCVTMDFNVSVLGVKHEGFIHVFYGENKTVAVVTQEALEDQSENKEGFETFESSFSLIASDTLVIDDV